MKTYPIYYSDSGIFPALYHRNVVKEEKTYKHRKRTTVEREYVQGLRWSTKHCEIVPTKSFRKDVDISFVITDDIDTFLRQKLPRFRD